MEINLHQFEPKTATRQEWDKYHDFRRKRHNEVNPGDEFTSNELVEKAAQQDDPMGESKRYLLYNGDTIIGSLNIGYLKEGTESYENNKHLIQTSGAVLKEYRGQGYGQILLREVQKVAKELDKSLILTSSSEDEGKMFLKKIGAQVALEGNENRLKFDEIDWDMVNEWNEEGTNRNPDTKLVQFDSLPEEYLEQFASLMTQIQNQQPLDDLDVNDIIITPEQLQARNNQIEQMGATQMTIITLEEDEIISGFTQMMKLPGKNMLYQHFTGVQSNHRGRGLGKWLKAAMLLHIKDKYPNTPFISTDNANSNAPMLSINDRLGFKKHKASVNAQIKIEQIDEFFQSQNKILN